MGQAVCKKAITVLKRETNHRGHDKDTRVHLRPWQMSRGQIDIHYIQLVIEP